MVHSFHYIGSITPSSDVIRIENDRPQMSYKVHFTYLHDLASQQWHINPVGDINIQFVEDLASRDVISGHDLDLEIKLNFSLLAYEYLEKNDLLPYHNIIPIYQYGIRLQSPSDIPNKKPAKIIHFHKNK